MKHLENSIPRFSDGSHPVQAAEDAQIAAEGNGFAGFTLVFNAQSESEVDEIISELKSKGVKILKEPQKVFWGGYSSYFADPDGN